MKLAWLKLTRSSYDPARTDNVLLKRRQEFDAAEYDIEIRGQVILARDKASGRTAVYGIGKLDDALLAPESDTAPATPEPPKTPAQPAPQSTPAPVQPRPQTTPQPSQKPWKRR